MAVLCRNRIFGYSLQENRIYASAKDSFGSWYGSNGSSDNAMAFDAGTPAPFTAVTCLGDVPYFFKENHLHRIIGSTQSVSACTGVKQGCQASVQILSDKLIYASGNQVSLYSSGRVECISQKLGRLDFVSACSALFEGRYYLSLTGGRDGGYLYVYDPSRDIWHRESLAPFTHSVRALSRLYTFAEDGTYLLTEGESAPPEEMKKVCWYAESTDLPVCDGEKKALSRVVVNAELKEGASLDVYVCYGSDGDYVFAGSACEGVSSLPVLLRRSDRVRVRLEGRGEVRIRSLVRIYTPGSHV